MAERAAEDVKTEVKEWCSEHWNPDRTVGEWWELLGESGWGTPTWPEEWFGKGLSGDLAAAARDGLQDAGVLGPPAGLSVMLAGPTIIAHGSDQVKQRYLGPIVTGQHAWCQLFSEPGAGSDLASLQCKAVRDGDEWVVNGQKVWTSGGHLADLGMLIVRSDPDAPKHKGITYFVVEMDQPGIEVVPLKEMTGRALFNEVFLTDARVRDEDMVGDLGEGWGVALTTLANERVGLGGGGSAGGGTPGRKAGMLAKRAGDFVESDPTKRRRAPSGTAAVFAGRNAGLMTQLAKTYGKNTDAVTRQRLAELYSLTEISRFTQLRSKAAMAAGRRPGPEASTGKLLMSKITRLSRDVGLSILGPAGALHGPDAPMGGLVQELALFSPAPSIYGGTDEIQKNIIGERVLGLPKEPGPDKDTPFRDLKVGTQR